MIVGKKFKICRRLGDRVFNKCQTPAFSKSLASKKFSGMKKKSPRARSEYASQLLEKQRVRFTYKIGERQFSNYVDKSTKSRGINPAQLLYRLLETRLDNFVYKMGLAQSRAAARQMVSHGHIVVNDQKVNIPSFSLRQGDKVSIRNGSRDKKIFSGLVDKIKNVKTPKWLKIDTENMTGEIIGDPEIAEVSSFLNFNSVIEFYSRT